MEARFGLNAGGLRRDKQDLPADGPARVMKQGDWGAVPDAGMKGFPMTAFSVPGRAQPKPNPEELKISEMTREARKAEESHKQALQKTVREGEAAALAAMARGKEEGLREGEERAWKKYQDALEEMQRNATTALTSLSNEKASLFLEFEGQVLELVSATFHRVFAGIADGHVDAVLPLVSKAIVALGHAAHVTIKVNPADYKTVQDNQDFWLPVDASLKDIRVVSDDRIPRSGCFVESDSTSVGIQADELAVRIDAELRRIFVAKAQVLKGLETPITSGVKAVTLPEVNETGEPES